MNKDEECDIEVGNKNKSWINDEENDDWEESGWSQENNLSDKKSTNTSSAIHENVQSTSIKKKHFR